MTSLAALLLATPLFGLSLHAPAVQPLVDPAVYGVLVADLQVTAPALIAGDDAEADESAAGDASTVSEGEGDASDASAKDAEEVDYREQIKTRNSIAKIHRPLGIATWAAMTLTIGLGFIQYYNLYGFFADQGSNPCVEGTAIFGQGQCSGSPWLHGAAAGLTTVLYAGTFTLSLMMPDPDDLASGKGEFAERLHLHKVLRWVHFGGMIAQIVLGIALANSVTGLDRANDYRTLQALGTLHLMTGLVTYGALTWAGALMTF